MAIDNKLYDEIKEYCKLNNLKVNEFINKIIRTGFNIEKYGNCPPFFVKNEANKLESLLLNNSINDVKIDDKGNDNVNDNIIIEPLKNEINKKTPIKSNKRKLN